MARQHLSRASKPLVPTRNGEAPLLAAQRRRWALATRAAIVICLLLSWTTSFGQSVDVGATIRVELGIEGDPEHLIEALQSAGYEAVFGGEAGDQELEEAQGVWIGRDVPFEAAKEIVHLALSKYSHLRYYRFFGNVGDEFPAEWDRTVYVGGSKWAAFRDTKAIESEEARVLFSKIASQQDLHHLIESFRK